MTFGPITINRPGATVVAGVMGPKGDAGKPGVDAVGIQGPPVFTPISAWISGATYVAGSATNGASFVSYNGGSYACTTLHTAGAFAVDLAAGLWEPVGTKGDKGDAGTPGSTWYEGTGAPAAAIGINNDYFFRVDTGDVLLKVTGVWTVIANIKGAAGNTLLTGVGAPSNTQGSNGDSYLDMTSGAPRIFGPKANGAWPASGVSLLGSGSGSVNPTGAFVVGHLIGAATADGKTIQDLGAPGDAAFKNTGITKGTLAAADDARIVNAITLAQAVAASYGDPLNFF